MIKRILAGIIVLVVLIVIGMMVISYQQRNAAIEDTLNSADATLTAIHD
jgi:glucose uptake protein GlcU